MPLVAVPDVLLAALFVVVASAISIAGMLVFRRLVPRSVVARHHATAADTFDMIALLYAVILGSLVAFGWTRFIDAQSNADAEAGHLGDLLRYADAFDEPFRSQVVADLLAYARSVVDDEWPALARGTTLRIASDPYDRVWATYQSIEPADAVDLVYLRLSLEHLTGLDEERRLRAVFAETQFAPPLWALLFVGGAIAIFFTYWFSEAPGVVVQAVLIGLLAGLFGFVLFLLLTLDFPYAGDVRVDSDAFVDLINVWTPQLEDPR